MNIRTLTVFAGLLLACDTSHIDLARPGDADSPAAWTIETIGATELIGAVTTVDHQPRVALISSSGVTVARRSEGGWRISEPAPAQAPQAAFSFDGTAHVITSAAGLMRHASWNEAAAEWTWDDVGRFTRVLALTLDGFGTAHTLAATSSSVVALALGEDGVWSQRRIKGAAVDLPHVSLTATGTTLLAAFPSEDGITLLTSEGRAWQREQVPAANVGERVLVRGADEGVLWILYRDQIDGGLRALRREPGAPWRGELVDWGKDTGELPSLRVEADGRAHACYFAGAQLRYALREPHEPWQISTIGSGEPRGGCDLAVDQRGGVHVGFVRRTSDGLRASLASVEVPSKLELTRRTVADTMPVARRRLSAQELGSIDSTVRHLVLAPDGDSLAAASDDLVLIGIKRGRVRAELGDYLAACRGRAQRVSLGLAVDETVEELARVNGEAERPRTSNDGRHLTVYLGAQVKMPPADAKPPLGDPMTTHRFATIDTTRAAEPRAFALEVHGFTDEPVFTGSGEHVAWLGGGDRTQVYVWSRRAKRVLHTLTLPAEVSGVQILGDQRIACQWVEEERTLVRTYDLESGEQLWQAEIGLPIRLLAGTELGISAGQILGLDTGVILMTAPEPPEEDGPERLSGLWTLASDNRTAVGPTSEGNWAVGNATNAKVRRILDTELDGRFRLGGHTNLEWRFVRGKTRVVAVTLDEVGVFDSGRGKLVRAINVGSLGSVTAILLAGEDRAVFLRREPGTTTFSALRFGLDRLRKTRDPVAKMLSAAPWLEATPLTDTGQLMAVQVPSAAKPGQCLLELETLALDAACVDANGGRVARRPGVACTRSLAASVDLRLEVTLFDNNGLRARAIGAGLKGWVAPTAWLPVRGEATSMALSADGDLVVLGDTDGNVIAGAPRSETHLGTVKREGKPTPCPDVSRPGAVTAVALPPALPIAAAGYADGQLFLWNLTTGKRIGEQRFSCDAPTALAFDGAGQTLYVGTSKGRIHRITLEPM